MAAPPIGEVVATMQAERSGHFDPDALEALLTAIPLALSIRDRFRDERSSLRLAAGRRQGSTSRLSSA